MVSRLGKIVFATTGAIITSVIAGALVVEYGILREDGEVIGQSTLEVPIAINPAIQPPEPLYIQAVSLRFFSELRDS